MGTLHPGKWEGLLIWHTCLARTQESICPIPGSSSLLWFVTFYLPNLPCVFLLGFIKAFDVKGRKWGEQCDLLNDVLWVQVLSRKVSFNIQNKTPFAKPQMATHWTSSSLPLVSLLVIHYVGPYFNFYAQSLFIEKWLSAWALENTK